MLRIWVNGETREVDADSTLASLLEDMALDPRTVAIELSGAVIPRVEFEQTKISEGDRVEVVRFVQGG